MEKAYSVHDVRGGVGIVALDKLLGGVVVERGAVVAILRRGEAGDADLDALRDSQRDDGERQAERENLDAPTIGLAPARRLRRAVLRAVEAEFDIEIPQSAMTPDNFDTVAAIEALVSVTLKAA